ncbi:nucleoside kinase [Microbacter margulisiae]|uniref:Uridine kinase n=1 Tax=Microbacter margulisiae TaxID=1350067 RepID=A0A7W5DP53_9PORP|nr:nucleoside kinase [Microbacter margulisiae]MBB3186505.1 uridine kinase [Microbacter margulisiae]
MDQPITIYCKNTNSYHQVTPGISLMEIFHLLKVNMPFQVVAAKVNNKVQSLDFVVYKPKDIEFIDVSTPSGMRVYVRTLSMVMAKAVNDVYGNATLHIEHPLAKGYFGCISVNGKCVAVDLNVIKDRMKEIISQNLPVICEEKQTTEVIELFRQRGQMDKVVLLETLGFLYSRYFRIGDFVDYYSSVLLPTTGELTLFDLEKYEEGFLLRIPNRTNPLVLEEYVDQPAMFHVFKEFISWNNLMGMRNVGDFNLACKQNKSYTLINIAEALHEKKVANIADMIVHRKESAKFVLISGPSSSGKTTFSKRLSVQLLVAGIKPLVISLDNYFVTRDKTPRDENGELDYESIDALDVDLLNQHLTSLLQGEEIELPTYNFEDGKRYFKGEKMKLKSDNVLVMEGIHALNPALTPAIPDANKFKIYVSALTTISLDNHNWISTTDTRLIRRIVRDFRYRNYSARETIARWDSVRNGEDKWIFPFQENADVMFNSALIFELAVLKKYVEPLLAEVPQNCSEFTEAHRLAKFLRFFLPIRDREIPPTSLLREFVGGSSFRY